MRSDYILSFVLFFPLLILQTTIIPLVSINGIVPDVILILLVFYSMRQGQLYGTILGFIYGFLFDIITGSLLGSTMLSYTLAGFTAGYFSNENKREMYFKSYSFALIIFLCTVIESVVKAFFTTIDLNASLLNMFFQQGMLPGIYTAVLSVFVIMFYPKRSLS